MKKLALLLGALSLVSSVAYAKEVVPAVEEVVVVEEVKAAPTLRVTNFGQSIEVDNYAGDHNKDGDGDIGNVMLGHTVGLAYGDDWTFSFFARKGWNMDTDEGVHSDGHRLEIDGWRAFDNYSLGFRWRQEADKDRYYVRGKYSYGMFSGEADVWYEANNLDVAGEQDNYQMELIPVKLTYGPFGIGYFFNYVKGVGDVNVPSNEPLTGDIDDQVEHQIRLYANFNLTDKLSTYAQYRYSLGREENDVDVYDAGDYQKIEVGASYAVTENLTVSTYYAYEYGDKTEEAGGHDKNLRYGEFWAGWNYTF